MPQPRIEIQMQAGPRAAAAATATAVPPPAGPPGGRRPHNLIVRVSDAELARIDECAAAEGMSRSEWVRDAVRRQVRSQRRRA